MVMTGQHHLAQLNVGLLKADPDDPAVAPFMRAIDKINALGRRSPGFVWMMEGSGGPNTGNTDTAIDGNPRYIANLTVWESVESLRAFAFDTVHRQFLARRADWFEPMEAPHLVMWWIPAGHRPPLVEGLARLAALRRAGDSAHAFGWNGAEWLGTADDGPAGVRPRRALGQG